LRASLQAFYQLRQDIEVNVGSPLTPVNAGNVTLLSFMGSVAWKPLSWLDVEDSANESSPSQVIPNLPTLTNVVGVSFHAASDQPVWLTRAQARFQTQATDSSGNGVAGYGYLDLSFQYRLAKPLLFFARVENLLDQPIPTPSGPSLRRGFSVALSGQI
jgi:outer membrane receptor protein involved in Fe transport